jgi:adenylylsulfate kinase
MPNSTTGFTLWLTGMNGAGKSTLAKYIEARFRALGRPVEVLEGEAVSELFTKGLGDTKEDRNLLVSRVGFIARAISASSGIAIVPALSPYREARDQLRRQIAKFVEVFVDCPVEELIKRDTTGRYKKALSGELPNFVGITDPYEPPANPEVVVRTDLEPVADSAQKIFQTLLNLGLLDGEAVKLLAGKKMAAQKVAKRATNKPKPASIRTGLKKATPKAPPAPAKKPAASTPATSTPAAKPAPAVAKKPEAAPKAVSGQKARPTASAARTAKRPKQA